MPHSAGKTCANAADSQCMEREASKPPPAQRQASMRGSMYDPWWRTERLLREAAQPEALCEQTRSCVWAELEGCAHSAVFLSLLGFSLQGRGAENRSVSFMAACGGTSASSPSSLSCKGGKSESW